MSGLSRMQSVETAVPFGIALTLTDGRRLGIDLTDFVHRTEAFKPFLADPAAFARVSIGDWGYTLEWENGLDMPLPTLLTIAEER